MQTYIELIRDTLKLRSLRLIFGAATLLPRSAAGVSFFFLPFPKEGTYHYRVRSLGRVVRKQQTPPPTTVLFPVLSFLFPPLLLQSPLHPLSQIYRPKASRNNQHVRISSWLDIFLLSSQVLTASDLSSFALTPKLPATQSSRAILGSFGIKYVVLPSALPLPQLKGLAYSCR